jgi:hypothetical protein
MVRAYLLDADDVPATRLFFAVDEASEADMLGADVGRASDDVAEYYYDSPGAAGQAWRARGLVDPEYGRLEASLDSGVGPWTDIGNGGELADPSAAGTPKTVWFRYVAHRWETTANPDMEFVVGLWALGRAAVDED